MKLNKIHENNHTQRKTRLRVVAIHCIPAMKAPHCLSFYHVCTSTPPTCDMVTRPSIPAGALLFTLLPPPPYRTGCVTVDSSPPRGTITFSGGRITFCPISALASILTVFTIFPLPAWLITFCPQPPWGAGA